MPEVSWIVLAGGRGTRSENPNLPKILQTVGDKTLLDLLFMSLDSGKDAEVIFVVWHGREKITEAIEVARHKYPSVKVMTVIDQGLGPVAALQEGSAKATSDYVGIVLGDTAISAPLHTLFSLSLESGMKKAAVCVRQSDHLFDSDSVSLDWGGELTHVSKKGRAPVLDKGQIWGVTGLSFIRREEIKSLDPNGIDVASAIFDAFELQDLIALRVSHYFRDSGTRARILKIRADWRGGSLTKRGARDSRRQAIFIDRDGTLIPNHPSGRRKVMSADLNGRVVQLIKEANEEGVPVFLCTNQPAVAKGFIEFGDVYLVHNHLQRLLIERGAHLDDVIFCPHHPDSGHVGERADLKFHCKCRKPNVGMIDACARTHGILLNPDSLFIGDSEADELAASAAGISYRHVGSV